MHFGHRHDADPLHTQRPTTAAQRRRLAAAAAPGRQEALCPEPQPPDRVPAERHAPSRSVCSNGLAASQWSSTC